MKLRVGALVVRSTVRAGISFPAQLIGSGVVGEVVGHGCPSTYDGRVEMNLVVWGEGAGYARTFEYGSVTEVAFHGWDDKA